MRMIGANLTRDGLTGFPVAGGGGKIDEVEHMDLDERLAPYTVTAVPRRARHGVIWHEVLDVRPAAMRDRDDDILDLRAYNATHVPQRTRSGLQWEPLPR